MSNKFPTDDERPWGFMSGDRWIPLPKTPMLLAELGPPPFDVVMPSGEVRRVIHEVLDERPDHAR